MNIDLIVQNNDNLRPRDEIKIEKLTASPYPDNRRIKILVELTPFRERPNIDISILDSDNRRVANTSAIALMNFRNSYVMHLRGIENTTGSYTVRAQLFYESLDQIQDTRDVTLNLPAPDQETNNSNT